MENTTVNRTGSNANGGKTLFAIGSYLLLTLLGLLFVAPILFMMVGSLKPDELVLSQAGTFKAFVPEKASLENYEDVFTRVDFVRFFFNSIPWLPMPLPDCAGADGYFYLLPSWH
jgi:ABC-type glycerol-3-phosphate transport system permease component